MSDASKSSFPGIAVELRAEICEGWHTILTLQIRLYVSLLAAGLAAGLGFPYLFLTSGQGWRMAAGSVVGALAHGILRWHERRKPCPFAVMTGILLANSIFAAGLVGFTGVRPLAYVLVFNSFLSAFLYQPRWCLVSGVLGMTLVASLDVLLGFRGLEDLAIMGWLVVATWAALVMTRTLRQQAGRIYTHSKEKLSLQETFGRFTGDFLTRRALQGGVALEGERREITVLFTDLRGFTTISEKLSPQQLVELINEHFQMSVEVIEKNGGHVNKFIGDAVFALFGAPDRNPWHRVDAVKAAIALRSALADLNGKREREGRPTLKMGIGMHAGEAVVGLIGSRTRAEFTAMGDTVNVASRLESLCKDRKTDLLISGAVADALDSSFGAVELEPAQVRGRSEPVRLFTIPSDGPQS